MGYPVVVTEPTGEGMETIVESIANIDTDGIITALEEIRDAIGGGGGNAVIFEANDIVDQGAIIGMEIDASYNDIEEALNAGKTVLISYTTTMQSGDDITVADNTFLISKLSEVSNTVSGETTITYTVTVNALNFVSHDIDGNLQYTMY